MSERQDYVALEWIKQEIAETLENAQQELQAVADSPDNASSMRSCLTAIHQVHGTLKVLGLEVALQFAEEMEATAQSLMNDSVPDAPRTQEILMQAILQMPMYLEQVQNDQQESLEQILPIINGLREVRGDERIGEPAQEAAPDFGIVNKKITKKTAEQFAASDGQVTVGKLRLRYQRSLKAILSKQDVRKNLGLLTKVFAMLAKICGKSPSGHLAQLGVAVVEAVTNGSVKLNAELSLSLRKIDKELKQLADEGIKKLARPVPEELILGMLRPLLNDAKETARILSIKETYVTADQQQREPEPQAVFGPDAETVSAVVKILIEEIVAAKDKLDLYVRSQVKSKDDLQSLIPVLEQVSNTLSVVELVEHQETIQAQIDVLSDAVSKDEEPTENVLMSVAGAFVQVETLLSPLVITSDDVIEPESMGNLDAAHSVVLNETRIGLAQCKDSVDDFKTSEWDHGKVEGLPKLLTDLSGGLSILTQTRAGDVLLACSGYIRTALLKESRVPELAEMEDLADVLTSVDYYLERFLENSKYPYTQMLDIAETSLEKLGFPISRIAELTEEDQQAAEEQIVTEDESQADEEFESSDSVDEDVADEQEDTAEEGDVTTEKVAVEAEVTDEQVEAAEEVAEVDAEEAEVPAEEVETAEEVAVDAEEVDVAAEEVEAVAEAAVDAEEAEVTVEAVDTSEEVTDVDAPEAEIAEEEVQAAEEVVEIVAEEAEVTAEEVEATEETVEADAAGAEVAEEDTVIPAEEVEVPVDEAADAPDDATETVEIIDDEIIEIFIEEADEVMQAINEQLPIWKSNPTDSQAQTELRRAFHTLKGSSRMVGASVVAELAWSIEDMLNRVIDGSISTGPAMMTMMDEVVERIPEGVKAFENQSPNVIDVSDLIASAELYSEGQGDTVKEKAIVEESWEEPVAEEAELEELQIVEAPIEESIEEPTEKEPELEELQIVEEPIEKPVEEEPELEDLTFVEEPGDAEVEEEPAEDSAFTERDLEEEVGEESVDVEVSLGDEPTEQEPSTTEIDLQAEEGAEPPDAETDHELVEIFREEAADHLAVLKAFLEQAQAGPLAVSEQLLAALHTLKGSAAMAEVDSVAQIANPLDNLANQLYRRNIKIENDLLDLLQQGTALVGTALGDIEEYPSKLVEGTDHFLQNLANLRSEIITDIDRDNRTVDSEVTPFRFDEIDLLLDATELLARWEDHELTSLQAELKLLDKTAEQSGRQELHSLVQGLLQAHSHLDLSSPPTEAVLKALQSGHEAILDLLDQIAAGQELSLDESVLEHLTSLIQEPIEEPLVEETALEELPIVEEPIEEPIEKPIEEEAEQIIEEPVEESIEKEIDATKQFVLDARDHLNNMAVAIQKWNEDVNNLKDLEQLNHHVNQIRSVAEISGVTAFIAMCAPVMQLCERISTSKLVGTESDVKLFEECRSRFADLLNDIKDGSEIEPAHDLIAKVEARIRNELDQQADEQESKKPEEPKAPEEPDEPQDEVDADVLPIFLEEADELLESIDQSIHDWDSDRSAPEHLENLLRQLHTVKGGSRMAGLNSLGEYSHRFETFLIDIQKTSATVDDEFFADVNRRQDEVVRRVDIYRRLAAGEIAAEDVSTLVGSVQAPVAETADVKPAEATGPEVAEESAPADTSQPTEPEDEVDEDVLPIFLEEADELLESIDQSIHEWNSNRNAPVHLENLLRHLHTVKGGLRMAGLNSLGEYSHNFESLLIEFQKTSAPVDDEFFADLNRRQDEVVRRVEIYKRLAAGEIALGELAARVRNGQAPVAATARTEPTRPSGTDAARQPAPTAVAEQAPVTKAEPTQESAPEAAAPEASTPAAPQEMIRVSADLLEDLISLATESSITRGRIEQQISNFVESLDEMDMTVRRVRDQIRRLEMETESRESVLRERQEEDDGDVDEDAPFDELEMDRYTLLQEISRSLLEGVSDMLDLKDTLLDTSRDAETLLLQQTRVGNDLQEGLTRTRMVPFSRLLPRLRRVTRQISAEVGKKVRFDAYNIEGELDRNVLERIVAPLEHMLRNAVDHGIESVEKRKAASKPEVGRISLRLSREGAYVVLQISDDGGGIDANQIKSKAIERGLMSETSDLSDQEILQFIMKAGFSTAESLTQISGRGVGMDVVDTELKQLGATLTIDSSLGVGTEFSIRIPFTVSINRALMVVVKEETYAVPLNTIEGIVRVSPYELEAYYEPDAPMFEYAGQPYRLEYMGKILARSDTPNLAGKTSPLPVILARSGDHAVALQVDSVIGSREVVVKSLGQQLSKIGGVSGATILGDGSVVIILDVMALVRASDAHDLLDHIPEEQEVDEGQHVRTVMVVDDSVTVRKVTSRIIERQGWNVMVAKDGVDAVSQLQDSYPDVVLLDIEMPKMDGFEVLRTVRRDERLKHLPIIIITSRTGEKHKQQAKELGVNEYLGKPFQEEVLLSTIEDVLADSNS